MANHSLKSTGEHGFSLLELLMSLLVIGIVWAAAIVTIVNVHPALRVDGGMQLVLTQLRQARQSAVDQRRNFAVTFVGTPA
jgi:prepilin-type N-terminal cleavage/methylation domain-containing protein